MAEKIPKREIARLRKRRHRGRTDLYRYLRENLPDLLAQGFGTNAGPSWDDLVLTLTRAGHTNRWGGPVTVEGVRKVFAGVKEDLAREQAEAATRPIPGRLAAPLRAVAPPNWRPTPTTPPPAEAPTPLATDTSTNPDAEAEAEAEAQLARLRRHIDERSGRKRA